MTKTTGALAIEARLKQFNAAVHQLQVQLEGDPSADPAVPGAPVSLAQLGALVADSDDIQHLCRLLPEEPVPATTG